MHFKSVKLIDYKLIVKGFLIKKQLLLIKKWNSNF